MLVTFTHPVAHLPFGPVQIIDANDYHNVLEGNIKGFLFTFVGALEKQGLHGHLRKVTAWSPVFAFSDFDDASTGQFAQCFQRVGSNVVGTSSQPPSSDVGDHKHSFGSPN